MSLIPLLLLADSRLPAGTHAHSGGLEAAVAAGRVHDAETLRVFLLGRLGSAGLTAAAFAAAAASHAKASVSGTGEPAASAAVAPGRSTAVSGQRATTAQSVAHPATSLWSIGSAESAPASPGAQSEPAALADRLALLDAEYDARTPSQVQRDVSRKLGRQLLRAARAGWPGPAIEAAAAVHPQGPHQPIAFGVAAAAAGVDEYETAAAAALGAVTGPANAATRLLGLDPDAVTTALAALSAQVHLVAAAAARVARGPAEDLPSVSAPMLDISAEQHATWEVRLFAS